MRALTQSEHQIQSAYFELVRMFYPGSKLIYAVPNGVNMAKPSTRVKYWREGRIPGVPDVNIDAARGGYHGLRIEFKRDVKQKPSTDQLNAHDQLRKEGYLVVIAFDHSTAWGLTKRYMQGEITQ